MTPQQAALFKQYQAHFGRADFGRANLHRIRTQGKGSATVSVAPVGVSPTESDCESAPVLPFYRSTWLDFTGRFLHFRGSPNDARWTIML
jgi:hypothetical protein